MPTYYHGTSADNLDSILKHGLKPVSCADRIWYDSFPEQVYLWDNDKVEFNQGFEFAFDSGSVALLKATNKRIIVVKVVAPKRMFWPDSSSCNMDNMGAVYTYNVPKRFIQEISISQDLSCLIPFLLANYNANSSGRHDIGKSDLELFAASLTKQEFNIFEAPISWRIVYTKQVNTLKRVA